MNKPLIVFGLIFILLNTSFCIYSRADPETENNLYNIETTYQNTNDNFTCIDPVKIEYNDLTEKRESQWHITSSGFNNYLRCGIEYNNSYSSNSDDLLYLSSFSEKSMNWSSDPDYIILSFDSYEDFEGLSNDYGTIEVNPHVSEENSLWYTFNHVFKDHQPYWTKYELELNPSMCYNDVINNDLLNEEGGFTDDMGLRFRFRSDESIEYTGWFLDNIQIKSINTVYYKLNPCDNMNHLITDIIHGGNWWLKDPFYNGWSCINQKTESIPDNINNSLEMFLQKTVFNHLSFYHDYYLENNSDYCYLEISNDAGITWNSLLRFTGLNADSISINISSFIGENVIIRWRIKTDIAGFSGYYNVRDICINGGYDTTPPITTGLISGDRLRGWFSSPVEFITTYTDDASGVYATYYSINSGPIIKYYGPMIINNEGEFYIEYWSVDKVGNKEEKQILETFKIDMSPPKISLIKPEKGLYFLGKKIILVDKILIIGGFTFKALAEDTYSNIYKVQFLLDDVEFYNTKIAPYRAYCSERHVGRGAIKVIAEDFAGNINEDKLYLNYNKYW